MTEARPESIVTDLDEARRAAQTLPRRLSSTGGGGDNSDGMQGRVLRLEDDVKEIKADLKAALKDLAYLRGKADSAPSTLQLIGFAVAVFVAAGVTHWFGR